MVWKVYWVAGILEGEGYFGFHSNQNNSGSVRLTLNMTDKDVMEKARDVLAPTATLRESHDGNPKHKPNYVLSINGGKAAGWMMTLYPLLGSRRRQQILESLTAWRELPGWGKTRRKWCRYLNTNVPRAIENRKSDG